MALPPDQNDVFVREVDEELRRDQMTHFWTRWGRWVIGLAIAALVGFAGWMLWQHRSGESAADDGELYANAIDDLGSNRIAAAEPALAKLATSDIDGYRAMAIFTQADVLLQKDDLKGAAAKFAAVAADEKLAKPYRDLALVRQTIAEFDTMPPQAVIDRLRPMTNKDSPWYGSAGELVAAAYLRLNQGDVAGKLYGEIARTETVPETIRQRAVQMAGVLGVDAATGTPTPKPAASGTPAPTTEEKKSQ